jgi:hypothetical protein
LLRSEVESLPPLEESQKTLLSLAHRANQEVVWNRILKYLLDPSEGHGLDNDVLRYFLAALNEEGVIDAVPVWRSDTIQVEDQVSMDDGEVDLVIREPGEWFICIEMKVWASEGTNQTIKYARSDSIDDENVDDYPEANQHYVYLTRPSGDKPSSEEFKTITWDTVSRHLRRSISEPSTNQSARGQAQVREFTDTINNQFNLHMGPQSNKEPIEDRIELYHEYRNEIQNLETAFEEFCKEEAQRWEGVFTGEYDPKGWSDEWNTRTAGSEGQIYHQDWVVDPNGPGDLSHSAFVHFEFKFDPDNLQRGQLQFILSVTGRKDISGILDDKKWASKMSEFCENSDEFEAVMPERAETTRKQVHISSKTYEGVENRTDFYETLVRAFEEHREMRSVVTELIEKNIPKA